jgi:hypothetical protein
MPFRHLTIASLFLAIAAAGSAPADACCLTDWLYGRQATPYVAGYAPVYSAGYAPVAPVSYIQPYASGYAPTTSLPAVTPVLSSGAYQAQRPAYATVYNNPSVYTGAPVGTNLQTAYSVPLTTTPQLLRGTQPLLGSGASSSYLGSSQFGATNVYPNSSYYRSNYGSSGAGVPATAMQATAVAPLFPNAPATPIRSGLGRFFGSLFGTNYQSSYYRAPITYYRPVTSVDPTLGTTVTVQQPCTSTVNQLQRVPYNSFQPSGPATMQPAPSYGSPTCETPNYGQPISGYQPAYEPGAIGQASAIGTAPGQFTVPIPSTTMPPSNLPPSNLPPSSYGQGGYQSQPSTAPLTGSPTSPRSQSDLSPIDPPSLNSYQQRSETSYRDASPTDEAPTRSDEAEPQPETQKSFWELQNSDDSTAMISPSKRYGAIRPDFQTREPRKAPSFTGIRPIRALEEDEPSPFRSELNQPKPAPTYDAPPLPPRTAPVGGYTTSVRVPVREAALTRQSYSAPQPIAPTKRDNTWSKAK